MNTNGAQVGARTDLKPAEMSCNLSFFDRDSHIRHLDHMDEARQDEGAKASRRPQQKHEKLAKNHYDAE